MARYGPLNIDHHDPEVVQRLINGVQVRAMTVDYWAAIIALAKMGYSDGQIAHALSKRRRQVMTTRNRFDVAPALPPGSNQFARIVNVPTRPRELG